MTILINILLGLNMLVALLMILVILMQRPKSEGLGAAFGGGVTENIFGAQTTNVLTKFTGWLAGIFFALTFVLSILYAQRSVGGSNLRRELMRTQAAAGAGQAEPVKSGMNSGVQSPAPPDKASSPQPPAAPSDVAAGAVAQPSASATTPSPARSVPAPNSP